MGMILSVLVVFGSTSDAPVYDTITNALSTECVICSAHRTPDMLNDLLKNTQAKVIIAGAGLAAHLPGVCASKTIKPIIGVPVKSNFDGLDALLSIIQMPPGIPVLSVGINQGAEAARNAQLMLKPYQTVTIIGDQKHKRVKACIELLEQFGAQYEFAEEVKADSINIVFIGLGKQVQSNNNLAIYVPLADENPAQASIKLIEQTTHGLWVGLNRGDNAAIAAVEILGYTEKLNAYRSDMAAKFKK